MRRDCDHGFFRSGQHTLADLFFCQEWSSRTSRDTAFPWYPLQGDFDGCPPQAPPRSSFPTPMRVRLPRLPRTKFIIKCAPPASCYGAAPRTSKNLLLPWSGWKCRERPRGHDCVLFALSTRTLQGGSQLLPMDCLTLRSTTLCSRARASASTRWPLWRRSLNVGAHPTTSAAAWCAQPTHRADGARHPIRFPGARAHLHHAAARLLADRAVAPTAVRASLTVCPLSVCEQSAPSSRCEHILEHPSAHGARPAGCAPLWATARAVRPARARSRPSTPHPRPSPHRLAEGVSRARALPAVRRLVLHAAGVGA